MYNLDQSNPYTKSPDFWQNLLYHPYEDFDVEGFKTDGKFDLSKVYTGIKDFFKGGKNVGESISLAGDILNVGANYYDHAQYLQDNERRAQRARRESYTNIPYDRQAYNSHLDNFYKAYGQTGTRYKSYQTGGEEDGDGMDQIPQQEQVVDFWNHPDYTPILEGDNDAKTIGMEIAASAIDPEKVPDIDVFKMLEDLNQRDQNSQNYQSQISELDAHISPVVQEIQRMGYRHSSVIGGQHNEGSKHYHGRALDLGLNTSFGGDPKRMDQFLQKDYPVLKRLFPNLKLRDERSRPDGQKVWSGSHFHLEI